MSRISRTVPVLAVAVMSLFAAGCGSSGENASCLSCHGKIEHASPAHSSCVACHGGEGRARSREDAHRTMFAPRNPSDPAVWEKSCGACHPYQLGRVRSGLMYTNTGIIRNIQLTWEGEDGRRYGARQDDLYDAEGKRVRVSGVAELDNLSGSSTASSAPSAMWGPKTAMPGAWDTAPAARPATFPAMPIPPTRAAT